MARDLRHNPCDSTARRRWRRCSTAAAWQPAAGRHRRRRVAGSNNSHSSHERSDPPGRRGSDRRSRPDRSSTISPAARDARREQVDEQPLDRRPIVADLVVARGRTRRRVLETIESRLAGQRRAAGSAALSLPVTQVAPGRGAGVVVDQILVAQGQREHTLPDQGLQRVLDLLGRALVDKAGCEPPDQADRPVGGTQQQRPGIRGDGAAVERSHHRPAIDGANANRSALQSIGIGELLRPRASPSRTRTFAHLEPRCTYFP